MAKVSFASQEEMDAVVNAAVETALLPIREQHASEIAALNEVIAKLRESGATADYTAFAKYPDLVELLKKTDLRPGALPALTALHIWGGAKSAMEISKLIPLTPKLGDTKGGVVSTPKIITAAMQKLETGLLSANTGVGIRVTSIRGKEGDSTVKRIRFQPVVDADFDEPAQDADATDNQVAAE